MDLSKIHERIDEIRSQRVYGEDGMWELTEDLYNELYDLFDVVRSNTCFIDEDTFDLDSVAFVHD